MGKANFAFASALALVMLVAMAVVAGTHDLPVRDPDGVVVPMYVQLPIICLLAWLIDVLPRALYRSRSIGRRFLTTFATVARERWTWSQTVWTGTGLLAWYLCYATFRNLKSYVPFVNPRIYDADLNRLDRMLWFGHEPAEVLHNIFGTGVAAQFFSLAYVLWIGLIPVTLAIALVWTRDRARSSWYVTAIAVDWALGVAGYFLLPTLGPFYSHTSSFHGLQHTYATTLEYQLLDDRQDVVANPHATHVVQTIAAWPSLHVGMMVTVCTFLVWAAMPKLLRVVGWIFLVCTVLGTIYLGWHFFIDTVSGAVLGAAGTWIAALATGNHIGLRPMVVQPADYESPVVDPASAALSRPA